MGTFHWVIRVLYYVPWLLTLLAAILFMVRGQRLAIVFLIGTAAGLLVHVAVDVNFVVHFVAPVGRSGTRNFERFSQVQSILTIAGLVTAGTSAIGLLLLALKMPKRATMATVYAPRWAARRPEEA